MSDPILIQAKIKDLEEQLQTKVQEREAAKKEAEQAATAASMSNADQRNYFEHLIKSYEAIDALIVSKFSSSS